VRTGGVRGWAAAGLLLLAGGPLHGQDSDGDGLSDEQEAGTCTSQTNPDTDGDTLSDGDEVNQHLTDPCNGDSDGDGLRDDWETIGVPYNGLLGPRRYALPRPATNPANHTALRKTIMVEADAMSSPFPLINQAPLLTGWFFNAPVSNPDGSMGIDLIVISDETGLSRTGWSYNPGIGLTWPPEFAGFKLNHFGTISERSNPDWYGPGGSSGPMRAAKLGAFRYAVFADTLGATSISGVAEFPGNDMIITLGRWWFGTQPLTPRQLSWMRNVALGVFAHELGHNLGLNHGGLAPVNYKPNYHSVMNYSWTVPRYIGGVTAGMLYAPLPPSGGQLAYAASWSPMYSDMAFPLIDENVVDENSTSLCGGCAGPHGGHVAPVGPPGPWGYGFLEFESGAGIDWNRNGIPGESPVAAALNNPIGGCLNYVCDGPACASIDICPHMGVNDWPNLQFAANGPNFASGVHGAVLPGDPEMTFEDAWMLGFVGGCSFEDPFEFYEAPVDGLHGRGGWKGWDNDPAFDAAMVAAPTYGGAGSLAVAGTTDLVHELCAAGLGSWSASVWQYIPSTFDSQGGGPFAGSYFVLLNAYEDGGHLESDWSVQLQFDSNDGLLKAFHGDGLNTIKTPYETDRWVRIQAIVDLDSDWTQVYYDDTLLAEYPWTGGVLGGGAGALDVAAVDLFANGATPIYYDELRIEQGCGDTLDSDDDGDGLDLRTEYRRLTNPCTADSDEDGLPDGIELELGTQPLSPDSDGDEVLDGADNCPRAFNPDQHDADGDGAGDACDCPGDADRDLDVDLDDLLAVLGSFGASAGGDTDGDGDTDIDDLLLVLGGFGSMCG
jgi:hypothetical protein